MRLWNGIACALLFCGCTKQKGVDPALAYTDRAMLDSNRVASNYYKHDASTIYPGNFGPHGNFRLRFNNVAFAALTDSGRLPTGNKMPEGSMIIKDVYRDGIVNVYAIMYKHNGTWLWGEIKPNGSAVYSMSSSVQLCVSCHAVPKSRDAVRVFDCY